MNLILEVVGRNARDLGEGRRKVFGTEGGRIGRAPDCDWVLANPYISRHHATVCCINGIFYIESMGENGVALNNAQAMLPQLERRALKSGDRLFIDEYEITVGLSSGPQDMQQSLLQTPPPPKNPVIDPFFADSPAPPRRPVDPLQPAEDLDPLKRLMVRNAPTQPTSPKREAAWNHTDGISDHFTPPPVPPREPAIPENWDQTNFTRSPKLTPGPQIVRPPPPPPAPVVREREQQPSAPAVVAPPPPPPRPQTSAPAGTFDVAAFLRNAGVEPESVPPEMAATLGLILRTVVQGVVEVLRARAEFRNQFRLPVTRVQMSENNPLKFAVNAEDALSSLLRRRNAGYLGPLEAFEDAFNDIRFHQLAVLAGMRAGFEGVMSRFEPQKLQQEFDKRLKRGALLSVASKLRYWDLYTDLFEEMASDPDTTFRRLFGEEFAMAYERQLEELKRGRGKTPL
jgi:type VI secretion system FHA domain protein